jgi:hypothetical protein
MKATGRLRIALKLRAQGGGAAERRARRRGAAIPPPRAPGSFKRIIGGAHARYGLAACFCGSSAGLT